MARHAPGYLSIDECAYHFSLRGMARTHTPEVYNGYRDRPSVELEVRTAGQSQSRHVQEHDGRLVSQYPVLPDLLAAPLYPLLGYSSLFLLNGLALLGVVALCAALALQLFGDPRLAALSPVILVGCTYTWEYSQAGWPHMLCLFLTLGAFTLGARALAATRRAAELGFAVGAGVALGLGFGVRLDTLCTAVALLLIFALPSPTRWRALLGLAVGCAPWLGLLAAVNDWKFGTLSPFSYGQNSGGTVLRYAPPAALAALVLAALYALTRPGLRRRWQPHATTLGLFVGLAAIVAVAALPSLRAALLMGARGALRLGVDLRVGDAAWEPALVHTPSGALVYLGAVKKALLQSCPYLPALWVLLPHLRAGQPRRAALLLLSVVPLCYFGFYAPFAWHGGLSLNLRYLLPALPFLSILTAWTLIELSRALTHRWLWTLWPAAAIVTLLGYAFLVESTPRGPGHHEALCLDLPLALAAAALLCAVAYRLASTRQRPIIAAMTGAVTIAGASWAGALAFHYDYPHAHAQRAKSYQHSLLVRQQVGMGSLVFIPIYENYTGLLDRSDVLLARPANDGSRDLLGLASHHLRHGRPVFAILPAHQVRHMAERPGQTGVRWTRLTDYGRDTLYALSLAQQRPLP